MCFLIKYTCSVKAIKVKQNNVAKGKRNDNSAMKLKPVLWSGKLGKDRMVKSSVDKIIYSHSKRLVLKIIVLESSVKS